MFEKSHPLFLLGLERRKRGLSALDRVLLPGEPEKKRVKKSESSTVQVPVPMKPVAVSSSFDPLATMGTNLALAATSGLHQPRFRLTSHTVTSDILRPSLSGSSTAVTRAPIVARNPLTSTCPVKLYPWKPNMYIV